MSTYDENEVGGQRHFDLRLWRKLLGYLRPYRRRLIMLGIVMIIVGAIDAGLPLFPMYAIDNYISTKNTDALPVFGFFYFLVILVQAVNVWLLIALAGKIEKCVVYDIRSSGFNRLQELSFSYFDRTSVGWLLARMTSDCERLGWILSWGFVDIIWGGAMMLVITAIMLVLNWRLGLTVLSVTPLLVWLSCKFQVLILHSYRLVRKNNSRITGAFTEGINGVATTKTLVREAENLEEFQGLTGKMRDCSVRSAIYSSLYLPLVLLIGTVGCGLALWLGGNGVIAHSITYGVLVAFTSYALQLFEPVQNVARIFAELQNAQAAGERVLAMIETEPEIQDRPEVIIKESKQGKPAMIGSVEFVDVDFAYRDGSKVLSGFNLMVESGCCLALVGESGGGKSTIVNLVSRFYEPTSGKILIDGIDYRQRSLQWLQSNLGIVLQTPHLFSGTIAENIRYGRLDAGAEEIEYAAKLVNAHNFISKLPDGYNTEVGEGGRALSTGQKQLLSFARAILADPVIFIMDEATSAVDTESEQLIQQALARILHNRTSFIIAHRLSTIRMADSIIVIDAGKIVEQGSHQQLLRRQGRYYRLHTAQMQNRVIGNLS